MSRYKNPANCASGDSPEFRRRLTALEARATALEAVNAGPGLEAARVAYLEALLPIGKPPDWLTAPDARDEGNPRLP